MRSVISILAVCALLIGASTGLAGEKAATSQLPAVLSGVADDVVSNNQADEVRGTLGLWQNKSFGMRHGVATGSTTLLEGVFAEFTFVDFDNGGESGTSLTVTGTIGGLTGIVGYDAEQGLVYEALGKGLSEQFDFAAKMEQDFSQGIEIPTLPMP